MLRSIADDVEVASTPSVQTGAATALATLRGNVDPDGQATTSHFDFGTSTGCSDRVRV
jgi:hypothetical protein